MRKKKSINTGRPSPALVPALSLLWVGSQAEGLYGVGRPESTGFWGVKVSMAGGGYLNFKAKENAFDGAAVQNQITFKTDDLGSDMEFPLPRLSENDQFNSKPEQNRLAYTAPAITDLFPDNDLADFEQFNKINMIASVTTTETERELTCDNPDHCNVSYDWDFTPVVDYMVPSIVHPGMTASVGIRGKNARWYKQDNELPVDLRIDGVSLDLSENYDTSSSLWTNREFVTGVVETEARNSGASVSALFRAAGLALMNKDTLPTCRYDDTCYDVIVKPTISEVSSTAGHAAGGQVVTFKGTSLDGKAVHVEVDGVECRVLSVAETEITCETGEKILDPGAVAPLSYVGGQGLTRYNIARAGWGLDWRSALATDRFISQEPWPAIDLSQRLGNYHSLTAWEGFFKAPTSGQYRFLMSCDDACEFKMSVDSPRDPASAERLLHRGRWTTYRDSDVADKRDPEGDGQRFSKWVTLAEGEHYYVEAALAQGGGYINMDVGMDIIPDVMPAEHSKFESQVQRVSVGQSGVNYDTLEVEITGPDGGLFTLNYRVPESTDTWSSGEIIAGGDVYQFQEAIKGYYQDQFGVDPIVSRTYWTIDGVETWESQPDIHSVRYTVQVKKPLEGPSVELILVSKDTTTGTIDIRYPLDVQLSTPPITGTFYVECYHPDGTMYATRDMHFGVGRNSFRNRLEQDCGFLDKKISVDSIKTNYPYEGWGREYQIRFDGIEANLPQYVIKQGFEPIVGVNVQYGGEIVRPYGEWLTWSVIPGDYFYTRTEAPAWLISIDDDDSSLEPVITCLECSTYSYTEGTSVITSFTRTGTVLSISGSNFVTPQKIEMGRIQCTNIVIGALADTITCDLDQEPPAGNWYPIVTEELGKVRIDSGVSPEFIALQITDVSPKIDVNPAGGDTMTITGTNFPTSIEDYNLQIIFGGSTICVPISVTSTVIICETEPFRPTSRRRMLATFDMEITFTDDEGTVSNTDTGFEFDPEPISATGITPSTISPIAFTTMEIQLYDLYPTAGMTREDFTVTLLPVELEPTQLEINNGGVRQLYVAAVNTDAKTLTLKYGGAYSGTYDLFIKSELNGNLDTSAFQLRVVVEVTDFQPRSGSIFGGTLLTITGGPFTTVDETLVKVGYQFNHFCDVVEFSETELTCRLPLTTERQERQDRLGSTDYFFDVIVFASTFEEANCEAVGGCKFEFLPAASLPTVTNVDSSFNIADGEYDVIIAGIDFTDAKEVIEFRLDQLESSATVTSATATEIVVRVNDLKSGTSTRMDLYLSSGVPMGFDLLLNGVTFEPVFLGLQENIGSSAGSIIRANVKGVGIDDQIMLQADGTDICQTSEVISYGVVECRTVVQEFAAGTVISVKDLNTNTVYTCDASAIATDCEYQTFDALAQMTVTSVSNTATDLSFVGTNLDGLSCQVFFEGLEADVCTIQSSTSVVATFTNGVPTTTVTSVAPELILITASGDHYASFDALATVSNPLDITNTPSIVSSFAGGQSLTIDAQGLTSDILLGKSEVTVCGETCVIDESNSNDSQMTCTTPVIATKRSILDYKVQNQSYLTGELIFDGTSSSAAQNAFDGLQLPTISWAHKDAWVGIKLKENYVGLVRQVSFFVNFGEEAVADNMFIEGSNDDFVSDIVELVAISTEVTEGWNSYDVSSQRPAFKSYRMRCQPDADPANDWYPLNTIGEIRFLGYEVREDAVEGTDNDCYLFRSENSNIQRCPDGSDNCDVASQVQWPEDFTTTSSASACDPLFYSPGDGSQWPATAASLSCPIKYVEFESSTVVDLGSTVTYQVDSTAVVDSISPRWGAVSGGTTITIEGRNFGTSIADITVILDDVVCPIDSVSDTQITCTTAPRIGLRDYDTKVEIYKAGSGTVALQGNNYRYCALWSEQSTWGQLPPIDGESVAVPTGLCLLVDIQNSPKLKLVQVDGGALIFPDNADPNYHATFDAKYINIRKGIMEVGTEREPYRSKLTITMHGERTDPTVPIFGRKSIGVSYGTLDIHGLRKKSWTDLDATVNPGENTLTVVEEVNWSVGDKIMVTSTDYNQFEAEFGLITAITSDGAKSTITIDTPFEFKHYAGTQNYGTKPDVLTMRAEVCNMSRNIIFRGDPETSAANQFGAHIMLHSPGNESVIGRIENLQLEDVGQAFLLGKYPIHYHMIGTVDQSYVANNVVMRSYNRGTTIHGVKNLLVYRNVYWDTMGHTIFVEDAAEIENVIAYNVVAGTKPSFSLLNTDQTPGCFWITHPNNHFIGNRAAGSTNYGFWMDYQDTAIGPSFDPNIKPILSKLGTFRDNVSHSVGNYGLRIFHGHSPDEPAVYENHLSYRCGKNGVMGGDLGKVVFRNITVADNANSGIEFERTTFSRDLIGECYAEDLTIIGVSDGNPGTTTHGIVAPQSDYWQVRNARFYNFNGDAAALGDCAHCDTPKKDSGARTTSFENLTFTNVANRIRWRFPFKGIFHDLDGSLTGLGADSYATAYWKHNDWPECTVDETVYDGIICPSPFAVQKINFYGAVGDIQEKKLYVWQYDQNKVRRLQTEPVQYDTSNASHIAWLKDARPDEHWTVPFVTQKRYWLRWLDGLDFTQLKLRIEPAMWQESDNHIELVMPFYEDREVIDFTTDVGGLADDTFYPEYDASTDGDYFVMGNNAVFNETEPNREMYFVVNGRDGSSELTIEGWRCRDHCPVDPPDDGELGPPKNWDDPTAWNEVFGEDRIPIAGEEVRILSSMNIVYNIGESPVFKNIAIDGRLSFEIGTAQNAKIHAQEIWVRRGEMFIGTAAEPYDGTVEFALYGSEDASTFVFDPLIAITNSNFIVTGTFNAFGKPRERVTRLLSSVQPGDTTLQVDAGLDYMAGDKLGLPATNVDVYDSETVTVSAYDEITGVITLEAATTGYHFGAADSTAADYSGIDMRGEVLQLSSSISITNTQESATTFRNWAVIVADFTDPNDLSFYQGTVDIDNISISGLSQEGAKALVQFNRAEFGIKLFRNSAISGGLVPGISIFDSANLVLEGNIVHDVIKYGINAEGNSGDAISINNNVVNFVRTENIWPIPYMTWLGNFAGIRVKNSPATTVTNNIVASVWHAGYLLQPDACGTASHTGNVAHSISGYGIIGQPTEVEQDCLQFDQFRAYKTRIGGMHMGGALKAKTVRINDLITIDCEAGLMAFGGTDEGRIEVSNSIFHGGQNIPNLDCPNSATCDNCLDKTGLILPVFGTHKYEVFEAPKKLSKMYKFDGLWGGSSSFTNLQFIGWDASTNNCGAKQAAISTNKSPNYHPLATFVDTVFENTAEEAMFNLRDPPQSWANLDDCGTFTCTGLYNVLLEFVNSSYSGSPVVSTLPTAKYQVSSDNKESQSIQMVSSCTEKTSWNGYVCENDNLGILLFESQDEDRMDRSTQPLFIVDEVTGFNNRLNAYMDQCWDGAYTCQFREQRFPTMLQVGQDYTINYTGSPPQAQRFTLYSDSTTEGVGSLITIPYPEAGAFKIYNVLQEPIEPTGWDYETENWAVPTGAYCGEHRYLGLTNTLQFWIEPGCTLLIRPRDAIMLAIRLETTVRNFYEDDGITTFYDTMASLLGINSADLKVVQVFEGSAIIQLIINSAEEGDPNAMETLVAIQDDFIANAESYSEDLGAPVMQVLTEEGEIVPMEGYEDFSDLTRNEEFMALYEVFMERVGCTLEQQQDFSTDNRKAEYDLKEQNRIELDTLRRDNRDAEELMEETNKVAEKELRKTDKRAAKQLKKDNDEAEKAFRDANRVAEQEMQASHTEAEQILAEANRGAEAELKERCSALRINGSGSGSADETGGETTSTLSSTAEVTTAASSSSSKKEKKKNKSMSMTKESSLSVSSTQEVKAQSAPVAEASSATESALVVVIVVLSLMLVSLSTFMCLYIRRSKKQAKENELRSTVPQDASSIRADGVEIPSSNYSSRQVSIDDSAMSSQKKAMHTRGQSTDFLHPNYNSASKFVSNSSQK